MLSKETNQKLMKSTPPDGGWGWVIVIGFAMCNLICTPVMQSFGLLYRDLFSDLGISNTDMGIILNLNSAFGFLLGMINGPALRIFGYRKVAIFGGLVLTCGNLFTSFSNTFIEFIIYYGLISSLGYSLATNAFSLAINSYFVQKRSTATGIAMTITGLGPIIIPLLISILMPLYDVRGTALILVGLTMNTIVAAMLLQPVKRHYKKETVDVEGTPEKGTDAPLPEDIPSVMDGEGYFVPRTASDVRRNVNSLISGSKTSLTSDVFRPDSKWWQSSRLSLNSLKTPVNVTDKLIKETEEVNTLLKDAVKVEDVTTKSPVEQKEAENETCWSKVVKFFDLDLLKDPGYVSICVGLSFALTGEFNFSLMLPFVLKDMAFDVEKTAFVMATIATSDIASRFITPFIGNRTNWTAKNLYLLSLTFLVLTRCMLLFVRSYKSVIIVAFFLGIAKGIRTVYMVLILPNYLPIEKLGSGAGMQAALNGLFLLIFGPLIGYVRDKTGSFSYGIIIMNLLTLTTITIWTIELIYKNFCNKKPAK